MNHSNLSILYVFTVIVALTTVAALDKYKTIGEQLAVSLNQTSWEGYQLLFESGTMGGFFTLEEAYTFVKIYKEKFPNLIVNLTRIGQTYENRTIYAFGITEIGNRNESDLSSFKDKGMMLLTSLHHSREPVSLTMNLYILAKLIFMYNNGDTEIINILNHNVIWFIPVVNTDGYKKVEEIFHKKGTNEDVWIRKNRHPDSKANCNKDEDVGVDLNRNYEFKFGLDNEGSSEDPCNEQFRGEDAFSESETRAVRDFIRKFQDNLGAVLNFHAYGNLWITPFNYEPTGNLLKQNLTLWQIYEDFRQKSNLNAKAKIGNAHHMIDYTANGEASDWITGTFGIFSLSPELGSTNKESDTFFPPKFVIWGILEENFPPVHYIIRGLGPNITTDYTSEYQQGSSAAAKIHSPLFGNSSQNLSTYGLQIYNDALTQAEFNLTFNITYKNLSHAYPVPEIVLTAHEYDIDYYGGYLKALPNDTVPYKTNGFSKHHDLLHILNKTKLIILTNKTTHNGSDVNVAYAVNKTLKISRKTFQKLYFTLVTNASIIADDCQLTLKMSKGGASVFNFTHKVFGDLLQTKPPEIRKYLPEGLFNLFLYLLAATTFLATLIFIYKYYRRHSNGKFPERGSNQNKKGVRIPHYSPTDYGSTEFDNIDGDEEEGI